MTKAMGLEATRGGLEKPAGARPLGRGRTSSLNAAFALFTMTLLRQAKSRRLLVLAALYALPVAFASLFRYYDVGWPGTGNGPAYAPTLAELTLILNLIPQTLLPLTALVFASGMIQDEVEEQTITYLLIRPLPRWSIYLAKLLATLVVTIGLTAVGTALVYVVIGWDRPDYWASGARARVFKTITLFALSLTAYHALFGFLSLVMRRAILLGIGYIIFIEVVVANIDFIIRKGTVMYYFRVLCERWMHVSEIWGGPGPPVNYHIDFATAPSLRACIATVAIASVVVVASACYLMNTREFRVKTPEGS